MGNTSSRTDLEPTFAAIATEYDAGFALDLYKQVAGKSVAVDGQNSLISPLSIATALATAGAGANGKTLEEIHACLKSPKGEAMHELFYQIKTAVLKCGTDEDGIEEDGPAISLANGLWLEKSMYLKREFENLVKTNYGTDLTVADFRGKAEEERTIVNKWARKLSDGKIQDLLPPGSLGPDTRMILANTLHFKGAWNERFYPEETIFEDFHMLDGKIVSVPFMTSKKRRYIERFENYTVLKLPYFRGDDQRSFSMFIVLPDTKYGIVQLEKDLDAKTVTTQWNFTQEREAGKFRLPKFRLSAGFRLKDALRGLGLNAPFSRQADFSNIVGVLDGPTRDLEELCLSDVFHKCFMEVNEEGTGTAVVGSAPVTAEHRSFKTSPPPIDFVADHPFLFLVKEEKTGVILFVGRISNPSLPD